MKKLMILVFMIGMVPFFANAVSNSSNTPVLGEWKYEVPSAPYGYEKGVLVISEKDSQLVGEVKLPDGYKIELKKLTFEDGIFSCGLYVDYEYVKVKVQIDGQKMSGNVDTSQGQMTLTAQKVESSK